jgi:uroporphyrinogen decarboxylase
MIQGKARKSGDSALIRLHVPDFDIAGQPGCWQDAAVLFGIEPLILETFDDPYWVKSFLGILQKRKMNYLQSMDGAPADLIELGGGDASTTVISPRIFQEFVAPFDTSLIEAAHKAGQRVVYHTCGGMMPILEDLAAMNPDALETFTPPVLGGDVDLSEAFRRIGEKVCFIGGLDQGRFFTECTTETTRREVRRCFEAAGLKGGYIIAPSDHFFDADPKLITAYAQEAAECWY